MFLKTFLVPAGPRTRKIEKVEEGRAAKAKAEAEDKMAHAQSGIGPSTELTEAIASLLARRTKSEEENEKTHVSLLCQVSDDETKLVPWGDTLEAETSEELATKVCDRCECKSDDAANAKEDACYVLVHFPDHEEGLVFITHIPDKAPIRQKMIYASTQGKLKLTVGLELISKDLRTDSHAELREVIQGFRALMEAEEELGREGQAGADPLTEEETRLQRKNKVSHAASNASYMQNSNSNKPSEALQVEDDVLSAIKQVKDKASTIVVVHTSSKGQERLVLRKSIDAEVSKDSVREALSMPRSDDGGDAGDAGASSPSTTSFVLVKHEDKLFLLLFCKDEASIKERMIFAMGTKVLQDTLRFHGINAFDSVPVSDAAAGADEIASAIGLEGAAKDESANKKANNFSRPKRPGRGKRGLVTRPKASE